ncbi:MAG TPA: extracellular solute-binding protein [Candidatus Nanopelagicaceae bacterium]|nr:extracellular solute-binding protein [Candidatus Nanopelagicaceae bacterium]
MSNQWRVLAASMAASFALLALAGCGPAAATTATVKPGLASVASAGSLQLLMDKYLGPPFIKGTGNQYQNQSAGSQGLAQEILAGEITPNVFIPIGAAPMQLLEPRFTKWAVQFAASPLVVAYYPKGPHAAELAKIAKGQLPIKDLFTLMATPGFRLGRTNPAVDPQGQAFIEMIHLAQKYLGVSAATAYSDLGGSHGSSQIFSETGLEPTLQAGELDAASAFLPQAVQLGLPYVALPDQINFGSPKDLAIYQAASLELATGQVVHGSLLDLEASVLNVGGSPAAAAAFVKFLLGAQARRTLTNEGYTILPPVLLGQRSAAPRSIRDLVRPT